jgi:hypothetical protein
MVRLDLAGCWDGWQFPKRAAFLFLIKLFKARVAQNIEDIESTPNDSLVCRVIRLSPNIAAVGPGNPTGGECLSRMLKWDVDAALGGAFETFRTFNLFLDSTGLLLKNNRVDHNK